MSLLAIAFSGFIYYISLCGATDNVKETPWPFNCFDDMTIYNKWLDVKENVALFVLSLVIVLHIFLYYRNESDKKKWLKAFLKHIIMSDLGGKEYSTRITIFRKQRGWRYFIHYLWSSLGYKDWWEKICDAPNLFKEYLVPYIRWDFPKGAEPAVYFEINDKTEDSIASECFRKGQPVKVDTLYIVDEELPKDEALLPEGNLKRAIQDYKTKTHMSYKKIRLLKRRANHLYACQIPHTSEDDNELWGVIVFDRYINPPLPLTKQLSSEKIDNYIKIIQFSINIIS